MMDNNNKKYIKNGIIGYSIATVLCGILAIVYEFLGHGVHSCHIRLLPVIPLAMLLLFVILHFKKVQNLYLPAFVALRLLVASEIARHAVTGIIAVYGTVYSKTKYLGYLSVAFLIAFIILSFVGLVKYLEKKGNK